MSLQVRGHTDLADAESTGGRNVSLVPTSDGTLLQEAADTLTLMVSRADQIPVNEMSMTVLDRLETVTNGPSVSVSTRSGDKRSMIDLPFRLRSIAGFTEQK